MKFFFRVTRREKLLEGKIYFCQVHFSRAVVGNKLRLSQKPRTYATKHFWPIVETLCLV